ncbi:unnamed protein product [Miscanthus lutarioriparius]|uniref:NB-ARC domain-containing protein n=1 Tax=Miscanthus lutarioriparius TaxID=422564 RepID=A0A811QHW8_9POAL|nr:unnamed protein product [Miscanthus lutarioriparius]
MGDCLKLQVPDGHPRGDSKPDPSGGTKPAGFGYLIVIDDVDDIEEGQWDTITSAFEGNGEGSRIMVTTTFRPTANRRSDTNGCVYKMRTLGMKDSMTIALRGRSAAELVQGSETLLKKCDGLPLALVSVARTCLLYLGIFPIDRPLRKNVIIRRWMAEGYARSEDITLSEQSVANGNLKTFIDRNIILPVKISKNAEVKTCKAHAIIHEFLLHRSMCEKFIMCSSRDKIVRHIFVHGDVGSDTNSTETWNMDLSRVRSLTVRRSAGCSISDFGKYKLIRVLDLEECTDMKDSHLKKICKLWNLRYLSLSHDITRLPKEIAKLKLLETLALSKTVVTTLPVEVIGLPCLTNLIGKFKLLDQDWKSSSEQERQSKSNELEELCRNSKMETLAGLVVDTGQLQGLLHLTLHMKNLRKVKIWFESTEVIDDFSDFNNDLSPRLVTKMCKRSSVGYKIRWPNLGEDFRMRQSLPQLDLGAGRRGACQAIVPNTSARPWCHVTGLHHSRTEDTWLRLRDGTCGSGVMTTLHPLVKANTTHRRHSTSWKASSSPGFPENVKPRC